MLRILMVKLLICLQVFNGELQIFLREHRNGMYRTDVYFLCKSIAEMPFFVLIPIIFTSICYYSIGLNPEITRYLIACGVIILTTNAATSFGKNHLRKIYFFFNITLLFLILFQGISFHVPVKLCQ